MKNINDILMRPKIIGAYLLVGLKNNFSSQIAKTTNMTYSHIEHTMKTVRDAGLITEEKRGRTNFLKYTPIGEKVAKGFKNILHLLEVKDGK